jgi:hypothetical protein
LQHVVLCGGLPRPQQRRGQKHLELSLADQDGNIGLKIRDISEKAVANIADILLDLIDVASYVYCADQAITRGGNGVDKMGAEWRRDLVFRIPVRKREIRERPTVAGPLAEMLGFLSEDTYQFQFQDLTERPPAAQYFDFGDSDCGVPIDSVMLFSGGLDSLGGAVVEAVSERKRVVLVSHRSNPKLDNRQKKLVSAIRDICKQNPPLHVPVWLSKHGAPEAEHTQRSRSFLYAALATVVARLFGHDRFRFYENGVISLNLPICDQVIGARATRSTHPKFISSLERILSEILGITFHVENPFLWTTKTEIIDLIGDAGCADLIALSISCIHTRDQTIAHTHCGKCSQCVHRRFSALASRFRDADPVEMYSLDLLTGSRNSTEEKTLIQSFIESARFMEKADEVQLLRRYGEIGRVIRQVGLPSTVAAERIHDLHRRHGCEVGRVLTDAIGKYAQQLWEGVLPATCTVVVAASHQNVPEIVTVESSLIAGTGPKQEGDGAGSNGDKSLTPKDAEILGQIGRDSFFGMRDSDLQRVHKKVFSSVLKDSTKEAWRSSLRRIRDYLHAPGSRAIQKNGQRS